MYMFCTLINNFFQKKKISLLYVTDTRLISITTIIIFDFKEDQNKKSIQPAHSTCSIPLSPIRPPTTLYVWNVGNKLVNFRDSQWNRTRN